MSGSTTELNLKTAVDSDDTADYLTLSLADSLRTVDALFNNVTGHIHSGTAQGGPIGTIPISAIPDGSITSAKIADGTLTSADIADGTIVAADLAANAISQYRAYQAAAGNSTTSASAVAIPSAITPAMTTVVDTVVLVYWTIALSMNSPGTMASLYIQQDAGGYQKIGAFNGPASGYVVTLSGCWPWLPSAGSHTWNLGWSIVGGVTLSQDSTVYTQLIAVELKR